MEEKEFCRPAFIIGIYCFKDNENDLFIYCEKAYNYDN